MKTMKLVLAFLMLSLLNTACSEELLDALLGGQVEIIDMDGDLFGAPLDCDDTDPDVNPITHEVYYDGIDNDCNPDTLDADADGDGFAPTEVSGGTDCDDFNAEVNPEAKEKDNGIDNDCDGDAIELELFDRDGDLFTRDYGSLETPIPDCNDNNKNINPGVDEEYYNGQDDDCDITTIDFDADGDGDHYSTDCDDNDARRFNGNTEIYGDGVDNDCDLATRDDDEDGDGVAAEFDCDDKDPKRSPLRSEIPGDGIDNDCSGADLVLNASSTDAYYVSKSGNDGNAGSAAAPFLTIQHAATQALANSKSYVYVAGGHYPENVDTEVSIVGGFNAAFTANDPAANQTIIEAQSEDAAVDVDDGDVSLIGLTILGRTSVSTSYKYGVQVNDGSVSLYASTVSGGKYTGTSTSTRVYGIFVNTANTVSIESSTVRANGSYRWDYGMYLSEQRGVYVANSTIEAAKTSAYGSHRCYPMYVYGGSGVFENNTIRCTGTNLNNAYAAQFSGGFWVLRNNTFGDFSAQSSSGPYVFYAEYGTFVMDGNSFAFGRSTNWGTMVDVEYGTFVLRNTKIKGGKLGSGYALYTYSADVFIDGLDIDIDGFGNSSFYGVYLYGGKSRVSNVDMDLNYTSSTFYGIYAEYGDDSVVRNFDIYVKETSSTTYGIYSDYNSLDIENFTFKNDLHTNSSFYGMYLYEGSNYVNNSSVTLVENTGTGDIYLLEVDYGRAHVYNSDFTVQKLGNSEGYGAYPYYGDVLLDNVNLTLNGFNGDQDFYGIYAEGGYTDIQGGSINIGDFRFTGSWNEVVGLWPDYSAGRASDLTINIGSQVGSTERFYVYGVYFDEAPWTFEDSTVTIKDNDQADVYPAYIEYGATDILRNTFKSGDADEYYGLYLQYGANGVFGNTFEVDGVVEDDAYAIYGDLDWANPFVANNYFESGKSEDDNTYGIYVNSYSTAVFANNIIVVGAAPGDSAYGFYKDSDDQLTVLESNVFVMEGGILSDFFYDTDAGTFSNVAALNDCDLWYGCISSNNNQIMSYSDLMLVDPANGDFHLKDGSPLIDAGSQISTWYQGSGNSLDMDGEPRTSGNGIDIGPDEK